MQTSSVIRFLGASLFVVGCLSFVFHMIYLIIIADFQSHSKYDVLFEHESSQRAHKIRSGGHIGHGFWSGLMCIIAGGLTLGGAGAWGKIGYHTFTSILLFLATCTCVAQLIIAIYYADREMKLGFVCCTRGCDRNVVNIEKNPESSPGCGEVRAMVAMESLIAISGIIGGFIAAWLVAMSCTESDPCACCDEIDVPPSGADSHPVVVITQAVNPQPPKKPPHSGATAESDYGYAQPSDISGQFRPGSDKQ